MTKLTADQARELFLIRNPDVRLTTQFLDPPPHKFFVFNFIADPEASPSPKGVMGYLKVRGTTFDTADEAEEFSESIIRTYDQYAVNIIHETGCPIPLVANDELYQNLANCPTELIDVGATYGAARSKFMKESKAADSRAREEIERKRVEAMRPADDCEDDGPLASYAKARSKLVTLVEAAESVLSRAVELHQQIRDLQWGETGSLAAFEAQDPSLKDTFLDYFRKFEERQGLSGSQIAEKGHECMLAAPERAETILQRLWGCRA
jgi:hypothetical protein